VTTTADQTRRSPLRASDAPSHALDEVDVPYGFIGLDIGARTVARFADEIAAAATVFWNGPMGGVELERSAAGTRTIADAVAATAATTVVGGGETVAAMRSFGLADQVSHLSTGGGATLELLERPASAESPPGWNPQAC
jgi:phosphoglycerate kinase